MKIGYKDVYETYCKLIIHSEAISWQRFHMFLVLNSILVLSWVTLFRGTDQLGLSQRLILGAISIVGIGTSIAWEDLGDRGRLYLDAYKAQAKHIETVETTWWENGITTAVMPFQIDLGAKGFSSSKFLLRVGPCVFLLFHAGLLLAMLAR